MNQKFESEIHEVAASQQTVYNCLSDLSCLEKVRDKIPSHQSGQLEFSSDSIAVNSPIGKVAMQIVEREEPKLVKFETVHSPVPMNLWIQVLPVDGQTAKMRLTIGADLPIFMKAMAAKPLQEAADKLAEALAMVPYGDIQP